MGKVFFYPDEFVCESTVPASYTVVTPAPVFRKVFMNSGESAELIIGTTGLYELYLNGENITRGNCAPFISNADDVVFYDRYDLTRKLKSGENVLEVLLGNGFANPYSGKIWGHTHRTCRNPALALCFENGKTSFTASDMLCRPSAVIMDDYRAGIYCDARLKNEGEWHAPIVCEKPAGRPYERTGAPVEPVRELKPVYVRRGGMRDYRIRDEFRNYLYNGDTVMGVTPVSGGLVFDFGENTSAVPVLKVRGKRGQKIEMQFTELISEGAPDPVNIDVYPNGCMQKDVYICAGESEETFIPPFTWHGCRYCYMYGAEPDQVTLTLRVVRSNAKVRSGFTCDDGISDKIYAACMNSLDANFQGIITDCPQREKNGWTGDAAISAENYMMRFMAEDNMADWLTCIRAAQHERGSLPQLVPSCNAKSDCVVWDSVLTFMPYYVYRHSGKKSIIDDNLPALLKNIDYYLDTRDERGIPENGMGDWLPVDSPRVDGYASPLGFCCGAIMSEMCRMAAEMLEATGRDGKKYINARTEIIHALLNEYDECGIIGRGRTEKYIKEGYRPCQTSQVLGLAFDIFPENEKAAALDALISMIEEKGGAFDCGFLGLRYIFHVLADNGYAELAYKMITRPSHPSYANMIYRGETTVWEWFQAPGGYVGSHNHHFQADVSEWYIKYITGIRVNPNGDDPNAILISPCFVSGINKASAWYDCPEGRVSVLWKRDGDTVKLNVKQSGKVKITYRLPEGTELVD